MFSLMFVVMAALPPQESQSRLTLTAQFGWQAHSATDPFGRYGTRAFTASAPNGQLSVFGKTWYAQVSGQLLRGPITGHAVDAEIQRHIMSLGRIHIGAGLEGSEIEFHHPVARIGDTTLATDRQLRMALANVDFGFGPYNRTNIRVAFVAGSLMNRSWSIMGVPSFIGSELLVNDQLAVVGGHIRASDIPARNRLVLNGSAEYLRVIGTRSPYTPSTELSGTAKATVRITGNAQRGLYIGAYGSFALAEVPLRASTAFGLRLVWRVR